MKLGAGLGHAALAVFLFRLVGRIPVAEAETLEGPEGQGVGVGRFLLAFVAALVLAFGTIGAVHRATSEVARQVYRKMDAA